jgi:hypothetical protein
MVLLSAVYLHFGTQHLNSFIVDNKFRAQALKSINDIFRLLSTTSPAFYHIKSSDPNGNDNAEYPSALADSFPGL